MPIETIEFNGQMYPAFQAEGNAARWVMPFALKVCQPTGKEFGFDIGCNRKEWAMPGAIRVDPLISTWDAYSLPPLDKKAWVEAQKTLDENYVFDKTGADYCFSSHCIEHLPNWVKALNYWNTRLKPGGVVFLYLPDMESQTYWRGWHNTKHVHYLTPRILREYFDDNNHIWQKVFVSGVDANNSFTCFAEKI